MATGDKLLIHPAILNNKSFGTMPDRLWRFYIELCLLSLDYGAEGEIPLIPDIAWYLRRDAEIVLEMIRVLEKWGLTRYISDNVHAWEVRGCEFIVLPRDHSLPWHKLRLRILERDNHTCAYCGQPGNHVDHIFPRNLGGGNEGQNLITACQSCNSSKSDNLVVDWYKQQSFFCEKKLEYIKVVQNGKT